MHRLFRPPLCGLVLLLPLLACPPAEPADAGPGSGDGDGDPGDGDGDGDGGDGGPPDGGLEEPPDGGAVDGGSSPDSGAVGGDGDADGGAGTIDCSSPSLTDGGGLAFEPYTAPPGCLYDDEGTGASIVIEDESTFLGAFSCPLPDGGVADAGSGAVSGVDWQQERLVLVYKLEQATVDGFYDDVDELVAVVTDPGGCFGRAPLYRTSFYRMPLGPSALRVDVCVVAPCMCGQPDEEPCPP